MRKAPFITCLAGIVAGSFAVGKIFGKLLNEQKGKIDKFRNYYNMLNQWMQIRQKGIGIETYLKKHGYQTVAIYGMGEIGMRLYEELKNTDIEINYAVDRQDSCPYTEMKICSKTEPLDKADIMIVTAIFDYENIKAEMKKKIDFTIVSLEEIIYELFMSQH